MGVYLQTIHTVVNKAIGITGKALDARSQVYENFNYRNYTSTAEVLATLTTTDQRKGNFPIFITINGETTEWWFKNGTLDSDLVEKVTVINEGGEGGAADAVTDIDY